MKLRPEVQAFAELMERQLRANDHKTGWKECNWQDLFRHAQNEMCELVTECSKSLRDPERVAEESADVANMVMMVADVCGGLGSKSTEETL